MAAIQVASVQNETDIAVNRVINAISEFMEIFKNSGITADDITNIIPFNRDDNKDEESY